MALLTKEQIRDAEDRATEIVPVPEWGGDVKIMALSGAERDLWDTWRVAQTKLPAATKFRNTRAYLLVLSVVNDADEKLYSHADIEWLGSKSGAAIDRIYERCFKLSKLGDADVEESVKNSEAAPSGDSGSDSASHSASPPSEKPKSE